MMRCLYFYISILVLAVAASCGRDSERLFPFGWTPAGDASDSLLIEMDKAMMSYAGADVLDSLVTRFCELSEKEDTENRYRHRRLYWRGNALFMSGEYEKGDSLRRMALQLCDSDAFPRDYRLYRMALEQPSDFIDNISRYRRYKSDLDLFLHTGDMVSGFNRAVMLMTLMSEAGMNREALRYALLSDSLLAQANLPLLRDNNRVNLASAYFACGDTLKAIKELRRLKASPVSSSIPSISAIIDYNLFEMSKDTLSLRNAWEMVRNSEELAKMRPLVAAAIINNVENSYANAEELSEALRSSADYDYSPSELLEISKALCNDAKSSDDSSLIIQRTEDFEEVVRQYIEQQHKGEIIAAETSAAIREVEAQERAHRERMKMGIWIGSSISLLILSAISILLIRLFNRQKRDSLLRQLEGERLRREIIAKDLMVVEKQKLNEELQNRMDEMVKAQEMESKTAASISRLIAATEVNNPLEQEDAEFLKRFMECYPKVSKTGRRLALYIRKGLDTAQIAKEMNIRKESVMQGRWRLRTQMGLDADVDLDVELRRL